MTAPCTYTGGPCWIPGTGYRPVTDTGTACALDDAPYAGKFDAPALIDVARFDGHLLPANSYALALANDLSTPPAAVPLPASGVLLAVAVAALMMRGGNERTR